MMPPTHHQTDITIIGAGICGLTAAYELAKKGYSITLLEESAQLGGLGTYFEWQSQYLDKFYHCQMPSDDDLIHLIRDLGLEDQMYWKPTRMGFIVDKKRYPFNGPIDLLRFSPLTFFERIRFGIISLLLRKLGEGKDLDNIRIEDWLVGLYGQSIWEKILQPLFQSKFGPAAGDMPALYIWERLGREKNTVSRGYLHGGLKKLIDTLETRLLELKVKIRKEARVEKIEETRSGKVTVRLETGQEIVSDWCISTMPLTIFKNCADRNLKSRFHIPDLKYQGVVNAMFFLDRPLDNFYWSPVVSSETEFDGIVEMTELIEPSHYLDHHVVYVMKYCDRESELFQEDADSIAERWTAQLLSLYPDLDLSPKNVKDVKIFKAPFVEPAYPLGYGQTKPAISDGDSHIFLATSAQVYPRITAWNSSVNFARKVVVELESRLRVSNRRSVELESVASS